MSMLPAPPSPSAPPGIAAAQFRELMRAVTNAVTIVAAGEPGARCGLTATAVCSVSDQPPTLLVCVNRGASTREVIARCRAFSVNVLAAGSETIADRFSGRDGATGNDKFATASWTTGITGAPVLVSSLVSFDCRVDALTDVATHSVIIGHVVAGWLAAPAAPLLYGRGRYWTLPAD